MNNQPSYSISELEKHLRKQGTLLKLSITTPFLLMITVVLTLQLAQKILYVQDGQGNVVTAWYQDPFTIIIVAIFFFAQMAAFAHYRAFEKKRKNLLTIIRIIGWSGTISSMDEIEKLTIVLQDKVAPSEERELVLRWLMYGTASEKETRDSLSESTLSRIELRREKSSLFHILINRIILKLGFLGTLIGLLMTFPNMKNAMLRLNESQGEMLFINDITKAIDGDHFAILTTLIATMLSLFAEFVTIQLISRQDADLDIALTYLSDWFVTDIAPLYTEEKQLEKTHNELKKLQEEMEKSKARLAEMVLHTGEQIEKVASFQKTLAVRVDELAIYEKDYRSLIATKHEAVLPKKHKSEGEKA